jgi:hypothetical protein
MSAVALASDATEEPFALATTHDLVPMTSGYPIWMANYTGHGQSRRFGRDSFETRSES